MPVCGCFHSYELERTSARRYRLTFPAGSLANLDRIITLSRLATSVNEVSRPGGWFGPGKSFTLAGVSNESQLRKLLDTLRRKITVDLSPEVGQCYSLGPYSVFSDEGERSNSLWGHSVNRAKYQRDGVASNALLGALNEFIGQSAMLEKIDCIVSAPKSDTFTPDLAGEWAKTLANTQQWQRLISLKTRRSERPQKVRSSTESEADMINRIAGSIEVKGSFRGCNVLVLDDIIGSGGHDKRNWTSFGGGRGCQRVRFVGG